MLNDPPSLYLPYLTQICLSTSRCEEGYGVQSVLKGRKLGVGEARPAQKVEKKPKHRVGRGNNPRMKPREDIKDEDLKKELRSGSVLLSYSEEQPIQ
ncbi:MAG: hypothetical protein WA421_11525 [Nitrososphaeraceae archaeon]